MRPKICCEHCILLLESGILYRATIIQLIMNIINKTLACAITSIMS